jgi:hypothetical protein
MQEMAVPVQQVVLRKLVVQEESVEPLVWEVHHIPEVSLVW